LTIQGVVAIVASSLSGGDPKASKGACLERLRPVKRRVVARPEGVAVREKILLFRVGDEIYGMGLRGLQEVRLSDTVVALPTPPYQVCAELAYRGRRLPVIHLRALFDVPLAAAPASARVLVTQGQGRALGLLVDEVLEVAEVEPSHLAPIPRLATLLDPAFFRGLFARQERIILVLNEDGLGGVDEVVQFYGAGG
jgi:purine-binding chemotaxis protein CheW